ncbi:diguanylate cyclase/phosphodiesterase (GGDEF & EAL domains) with PAS/PAC sensor(s) [hydrothermal vent metagenome]|uniref:Diguanylate cyclase/phosphodiesterase (GGDEF & EAL domains) with PAS/PAC sensor(S) n=1 Tax=hydrothermal vent metagenome TaxID=652676 RepID=A0A3B0ZS99_9ZZZZ
MKNALNTSNGIESNKLRVRLAPFELIVHLIVAILLIAKNVDVIPVSLYKMFFFLVVLIAVTRFACTIVGSKEINSDFIPITGNIIGGVAWGGVFLFLTLSGYTEIINESYWFVATIILLCAALAGSAFRTHLFLSFSIPLVVLPFSFAVYQSHTEQMILWAVVLFVSFFLSVATRGFEEISVRYSQSIKGNAELLDKLVVARDNAVRSQQDTEHENRTITNEIQERKRIEHKIRASEQELSRIIQDMQDTFFRMDTKGNIVRISPSVQYLLGYSDHDLLNKPLARIFFSEKEYKLFLKSLDEYFGVVQNYEVKLKHYLDYVVWTSMNFHFYQDENGNNCGVEGTIRDLSKRKRAEEALYQEKERLHVTLQSIGDGVITTDVTGVVEYINPTAEVMTGWSTKDGKGLPLSTVLNLIDENNQMLVVLSMDKWLHKGECSTFSNHSLLIHRENKNETAIELTGSPIKDSKQGVVGAVLVFRDVTKLRSLAKQLSYQATHDALTGLINRIEFDRRVNSIIEKTCDFDHIHALLYLDLDQFKVVNDTCGHHAGDELLKQLTALLEGALRESDTLARLGGDEFGVLLRGCPMSKAADIAEELRRKVEEYRFIWDGRAFRVGLSIGVVAITSETEGLTELLSAADSACYVAKERGRNCVHVFEVDDEAVAKHHGQMQWMQRIQQALDEDLFELHMQPIISVSDPRSKETHGELLIRMVEKLNDGNERIISPNAFIPSAERYHLMPQIDRWVVRTALHALIDEKHAALGLSTCAINLSGQSLGDLKLLGFIMDTIKETGVDPRILCFEITESAVIANLDIAKEFIVKLKETGCRFALDDFGSGLSSFSYLKNLPVDYVKLDGSLVRDIADSNVSQAMVHAVNYVTHVMGMKSIAEYVETEAIFLVLKRISVDYAQGYAIQKPKFFARAVTNRKKKPIAVSPD